MSDQPPVRDWSYPFETTDNGSPEDQATIYYRALAQASTGFFPVGSNGLWHGGIHFDSATGGALQQGNGVRCIADGEVVAYRIDSEYPAIEYENGPKNAEYSTGFVLVRHKLQLPAQNADNGAALSGDQPSGSSEQDTAAGKPNSTLVFYSLYMHLLNLAAYKYEEAMAPIAADSDTQSKEPPTFLTSYTVGQAARDQLNGRIGLNLRDESHQIKGLAISGAKLVLGPAKRDWPGYFPVLRINTGATEPAELSPAGLFAYKDELEGPNLDATADTIVNLDDPVPISAGELVGYPGSYQRYTDQQPAPLVHIEVFSTDDVPAFVKTSRERAPELNQRRTDSAQNTTRQSNASDKEKPSPWAWDGFSFVEESTSLDQQMARSLIANRGARPEEERDYNAVANTTDGSALFKKIREDIDLDNDGQLSKEEIKSALSNPATAKSLSHLIVKFESEWGGSMGKWDALDRYMTGLNETDWAKEKQRIQRLQWWDGVTELSAPNAWHFHPIGLIANFPKTCSCGQDITEADLDLILPDDVKANGLFYRAHDRSVRSYDKSRFLTQLNRFLRSYEINTCARKAHFLSQMIHECDELRTNEEYRNSDGSMPRGWSNYNGGANYHGRGLIQLTHRSNYASYGNAVGNPDIASQPDIVSHSILETTRSGCWYWRSGSGWGDINPKADSNDFFAITVAVNGGFRHVANRFIALNKLARIFQADNCQTNPGLNFSNYEIESSSLTNSNWYKSHRSIAERAQNSIDSAEYNTNDD
ncbi:glycoside hydrolase family 19 protein [Salinisphaera sp.]|uniref:glycoside hydrolase family 19 protein n=1 Tax=Salinisphaera sp. TaxID=1914330 RepID=UPI000C4A5829|nr:glycoside hydrolase family 19 protein [Salinisphaera sp.]MBS63983.1 hypothetical protein [Salinisphaera sp.]